MDETSDEPVTGVPVTAVPREPVPREPAELPVAVDVVLGATGLVVRAGLVGLRAAGRLTGPATGWLAHPVPLPESVHPASILAGMAAVGRSERSALAVTVGELLDEWLPPVVESVLTRLDLTRVVIDHVQLDEVVAAVDLDGAVARVQIDPIVDRVDIEAILDRVDVDGVIGRADLEAVVSRVDLDGAVARVDIGAVVDRVDIDAIVDKIDLDQIAARLDVDAVVGRANLDEAVKRVDLDAIIDRIDLIAIVEEIIDAIDLPGIIRESTGSMASETVRGVRMSSINADDAITRAVGGGLFRRRKARAETELAEHARDPDNRDPDNQGADA